MVLRDFMWEIFQSTGHIGAYLTYRECVNYQHHNPEATENIPEQLH